MERLRYEVEKREEQLLHFELENLEVDNQMMSHFENCPLNLFRNRDTESHKLIEEGKKFYLSCFP